MIGVFVTFRFADQMDEQALRRIAEAASPKFAGMPGLRSKAFTISPQGRRATNVYVWDTEEAARAFFSDALLTRITELYGVKPEVEFVRIASLVVNPAA